jgi:hypothetical protein
MFVGGLIHFFVWGKGKTKLIDISSYLVLGVFFYGFSSGNKYVSFFAWLMMTAIVIYFVVLKKK